MRMWARALCIGLTQLVAGEIPAPPGRLVDVGATKLHINCSGTGSPAVILEAGFPGSSLDWVLVQPRVADFTRVCSYDRAGFGWSETGEPPRSASRIAEELHTLLSGAGIVPPYVLVGHSMGGIYVRSFARKYPATVVGLVLVDATHEDQWEYEPVRYWVQGASKAIRVPPPDVARPAAVAPILKQMWATERWKNGERQEREAIKLTIEEVHKEPKRLPAVPLAVVSAGAEVGWLENAPPEALKTQQLQRELAALSPLGTWIPVSGANHYIHLSQPAAVVEAIRQVVQAGRSMRRIPEAKQ